MDPGDTRSILENWVGSVQDAPALIWLPNPSAQNDEPVRWTYAQLWLHAARIGRALLGDGPKEHGAAAGDRIGVAISEGPELVLVTVALLAYGLVLVPIDVSDPVDRIRAVLDASSPALVILRGDDAKRDEARLVQAGARAVVDAHKLCFGEAGVVRPPSLADACAAHPALAPLLAIEPPASATSHIFFTSGSTGRPKGCLLHRGALAAYCAANVRAHDVRGPPECDVVFVASPHTFDPCLGDIASTLCAGAAVAVAPRAMIALSLGGCLARARATHVTTTPTAWRAVDPAVSPPGLRVVALGGEPMPVSLAAAWLTRVRVLNTYGVTECCVYQAAHELGSADEARLFGRPFEGTTAFLAAADGGDWRARVPEGSGEVGEIWLGGPQVGLRYCARPEGTAEGAGFHALTDPAHVAEAGGTVLFRTGDLAVATPRGWLLRGRRDGQVKVRGRRLELAEVEAAIDSGAARALVHTAGAYVDAGGALVAWCALRKGSEAATEPPPRDAGPPADDAVAAEAHAAAEIEAADAAIAQGGGAELLCAVIRLACSRQLADWAVPTRIALTHRQLPCTASGKLDRRALRAWPLPSRSALMASDADGGALSDDGADWAVDADGEAVTVGIPRLDRTRALSDVERDVARAWARVLGLGVESLRADASFVQLGGDSIGALHVCKLLASGATGEVGGSASSEWGLDLPVGPLELLQAPRLDKFAHLVARARRRERELESSVEEERRSQPARPSEGRQAASANAPEASAASREQQQLAQAAVLARQAAGGGHATALRALIALLLPSDPRERQTQAPHGTQARDRCALDGVRADDVREGEHAVAAALRAACASGRAECARVCVAALPAAARLVGPSGERALHAAARAPMPEVVAIAREAGAALSDLDANRQSPLHHAARAGSPVRVLEALVAVSCAPKGRGGARGGRSVMGVPVEGTDQTLARALNALDVWGRAPLHWASMNGHAHSVEWLLAAGAERALPDAAGETALQIAERRALCSAAERAGAGPPARWSSVAKALGGAGTTKALRASKLHQTH